MRSILVGVVLLFVGIQSTFAATVLFDDEVASDPIFAATGADVDYAEFFGIGDLSGFFLPLNEDPFSSLSFGVGWDLADPDDGTLIAGGFAVEDLTGELLSGTATAVGFVGDIIEIRLENIGGSLSSLVTGALLMELDLGSLGGFGLDGLVEGTYSSATITLSNIETLQVIPLPEGPYLLVSLALLGLLAKRRNRRAFRA